MIWGFALGSVGADAPNSLKVDNEGNIYLAGYFGGQMDVDPSPEEKLINSGTGRDGFLIKYDKNGNLLWAKSFGNIETIPFTLNDPRFEEGVDLDIDADNNVYLTGFLMALLILTVLKETRQEILWFPIPRALFWLSLILKASF